MVEPADGASATGHRLGAPESFGVSTLEPGLRPPTQAPGRKVSLRVQMLDDTQEVFQISQRSPGKVLFDLICVHLNLVEGDYFGLEYQDQRKMTVWLDLLKPTMKQIRRPKNTILRFVVKFFPPDHTQIMEELTHWQHLLHNKYLPDQDAIRDKITDCHRKHVGQTPAESDYQLLEIARRLEMYGVRLHPAKDREGTKLSLAVAHTGVLVFQGYTKINAFNWSKIRKLSFKRKRFLIKLRGDPQSGHHDTLEFAMASRDCCKIFWKICVEYHAFFRLFEEPKPKPKPILFTRGSSFRFSGRTQKQIIDYVKDAELKKKKIISSAVLQSVTSVPMEGRPDPAGQAGTNGAREPSGATSAANGFRDHSAAPGSDGRQEHKGTGPSCRANKGSSSSIPYIDCSDVDSECDGAKSGAGRSRANGGDDAETDKRAGCYQQDGKAQPRATPLANRNGGDPSRSNRVGNGSREIDDDDSLSNNNSGCYGGRPPPLHSTLLDEIFQGRETRPFGAGTQSHQCSSPLMSSFHQRTNSLGHGEVANGHPRWDDAGHDFSKRPGGTPAVPPPRRYGSCSPVSVVSNGTPARSAKHCNDNLRNRSDTDPFVLSRLTSTPVYPSGAHHHAGLRAPTPCSAPLERRMIITNGNHRGPLLIPAQPRSNTLQRSFGQRGAPAAQNNRNNLNRTVQMIDGSTSSGSDTSDTESDAGSGAYGPPLVFGNPAAVGSANSVHSNGVSSPPLAHCKFSFGSLKLVDANDGEAEQGCYACTGEDAGGRVFSC
uniref:FERM, RhoGEF and pleckstrin domain-containing protein 1-like n=1 Tax=Hippocampus comes TaxID=109280 RepID=A0A3Q3DAZ0_HIPCM